MDCTHYLMKLGPTFSCSSRRCSYFKNSQHRFSSLRALTLKELSDALFMPAEYFL